MKKRILSALLALAMLLTLCPLSTFAAEAETAVYQETEVHVSDAEDMPDNDELFFMYVWSMFYGGGHSFLDSEYGKTKFAEGTANRKIYEILVGFVKEVASGKQASTEIKIDTTGMGITYDTAAKVLSGVDTRAIVNVLMADCTYNLYWYDKTSGWSAPFSYYSTGEVPEITFKFTVAKDYATGEYAADTAKTGATTTAVSNAQKVVNDNNGKSDYEKLVAYRKYICDAVTYNSAAASDNWDEGYGDPWQLIYAFDNDPTTNIVCEGYAKAFKYLCDLSGIECYTVSGVMAGGTGAGGHMWNIVKLGGKNYLVDVTNCDTGTVGAPDKLFLRGGTEGPKGTYVFEGVTFTYYNSTSEGNHVDQYELYGDAILTLETEDYKDASAPDSIELTLAPEADGKAGDNVTPYYLVPTISNLGIENPKRVTLSAVTKKDGAETNQAVEWVLSRGTDGVTLTPNDDGTATLTISNSANIDYNPETGYIGGYSVAVTAICGTTSVQQVIYIWGYPKTASFVSIFQGTDKIETTTIACGGSAAYTAKVYDQYGQEIFEGREVADGKRGSDGKLVYQKMPAPTVTWSVSSDAAGGSGVTVDNGTVNVAESAVAGDYTVTATSGSGSASVKVTVPAAGAIILTDSMVSLSATSTTYNGQAQVPAVVGLTENNDYDVSCFRNGAVTTDFTSAGTITVAVTGKGKYTGTVTKTFTILAKEVTPAITGTATKTYDGTTELPENHGLEITLTGIVDGDNVTAEAASYAYDSADAGQRTITASGIALGGGRKDNYKLSSNTATTAGIIEKSRPAIEFKSGFTRNKTYDGQAIANPAADDLTITGAAYENVAFTWYKGSETDENKLEAAPADAGQYVVKASIASTNNTEAANTVSSIITISKAVSSVTITSAPGKAYDGSPVSTPAYTRSGTGAVTVEYKQRGASDASYSATTPFAAGDYTVRVTAAEDTNYNEASDTKDFTIAKRTVVITWSGTAFTYNGNPQVPVASVSNRVGSDDVSVTVTGEQTSAGNNYTATADALTGAAVGNYQLPATKPTTSFTIGKANPTVTDVSKSDPEKIYESTALNSIILTHASGDTPGTVALNPGQTLTVGTREYNWTFTPTGDTASNYNTDTGKISLTVEADTLKGIAITNAPAKINYTYGENFDKTGMVITATYASGAANVVTDVQIIPEKLTVNTTEVTITYQGQTTTQAITVIPLAITVTPTSGLSKEYGAADPELTYTVSPSLIDGDTLTGALSYEGWVEDGKANVGDHTIIKGSLTATSNYTMTVANGVKFTITKPSLNNATASLSEASYTYDGTAKEPTVTVTKGGSAVDAKEYDVSYSSTNGGDNDHTNAGTVTVTVTAKNSGNYSGSCSTTFTIAPKVLTPAITGTTTKTYDGTDIAPADLSITLNGRVDDDNVTATAGSYTYNSADVNGATTITAAGITLAGTAKDNYTLSGTTATIDGTITKATVSITWGSISQSMGYSGKAAEITAPTVSAQGNVTVSVPPGYSYKAEGGETFTNGLPTNAGTYTVRASIAESGNLSAAQADMTLTITKVSLTISGATVTPKTYDSTTTASITGVTFSGLVNGETLAASDYTATGEFDDRNAGTNKDVTVTVTLSGTTKASNYTLSNGAFKTTGEIKKADSTITTAPTAAGITYGQALNDSNLNSGAGSVPGAFAWTDGTAKPNAGTAQYEVTFTPTDTNYNTAKTTVSVTVAKATPTLTVPTASAIQYGQKLSDSTLTGGTAANLNGGGTVAGSWSWASGSTQPTASGTFAAAFTPTDIANYEKPETVNVSVTVNAATPSITLTAPSHQVAGKDVSVECKATNPHDAALDDLPAVALTYKIGDGAEQTITGGSFTIPSETAVDTVIIITATTAAVEGKYTAATKTVTVTVTDKIPVTITGVTMTGRTYNGNPIGYTGTPVVKTLGGETVTDATVTYTWSSGEAPVNAGNYSLTIAVSGDKYIGSITIDFTISKAAITITAENKSAVAGSAKPALTYTVSGLASGDVLAAEPTLACEADMDTVGSYTITAGGAAVPNAENYNAEITYVVGTLTVTAKPSGSGGGGGYVPSTPSTPGTPGASSLPVSTTGQNSSAVTTTTTAAPTASTSGGTATTTVNTTMGNEIVKQAVANNSENVVIAPSVTGSVTKAEISIPASTVGQIGNQTNASLTVSTPVADVTIPNGGLSRLSSAGGTVTVTAEQVGRTVELSVTAGGRTVERVPGGVTLTVPMSYATPGTVAVLVHDNGAREVVRKSVADNGSMTIPLDGSAKLEIVDNSKYFYDVPATSWAAGAVAFASSHELFNGTGADTFSPNQAMSRGMLATVLHNLENNPLQPITGAFTDVSNSQWYAEGVAWAAAKGIVSGYGNGKFGPNDNITREQLAVMLWRYAGSPGASNRNLYFADANKVSNWALDALCWATENGIINGKGNGILDPTGNATRAETAQMLKNFMENQ